MAAGSPPARRSSSRAWPDPRFSRFCLTMRTSQWSDNADITMRGYRADLPIISHDLPVIPQSAAIRNQEAAPLGRLLLTAEAIGMGGSADDEPCALYGSENLAGCQGRVERPIGSDGVAGRFV